MYPFVRLTRPSSDCAAHGRRVVDFGVGEPREETPRVHPRRAGRRARADVDLPAGRGAAGAARGDRGLGRPALRRGARPRHARSCRRSAPRRRSSTWRRCVGRRRRRGDDARLPGARARRAVRRARGRRAAAARRSAGFLPDLDARSTGRARPAVAQLPEQPDGARPLRSSFYERAAALAREHDFVAGLRRGLLRALLRRRARRSRRSRSATCATSWCSTRCPSARRCPATARASWPAIRSSSPR